MWTRGHYCFKHVLIFRRWAAEKLAKQNVFFFCEEHTMWHFATKCAAVKFAEPWMSNHFSESRHPTNIGSATCPECPTKDGRGKSCRLNPRECGPEVVQGAGGVTTSPTLLGPVLVWSQHNYQKLLLTVTWGISSPPGAAAPANLPRGKVGMKMNELKLNRLAVFPPFAVLLHSSRQTWSWRGLRPATAWLCTLNNDLTCLACYLNKFC